MSLEAIKALLTRRIGLDPASVGPNIVVSAIERSMARCGLTDPEAYLKTLQSSSELWEKLVDEVVVPETWFFRDWEPFVFLGRYATTEWMSGNGGRQVRILSVPCASGEEPYSIAMALLDAGLGRQSFQVEAVDISGEALRRAKRAVYGRASFRGDNLEFRDRYFEETVSGYRLVSEVRDAVHFMQANLLDQPFVATPGPYDVIFCRNLLIYFDEAARGRAIATLTRLLDDRGLLFTGYVETLSVLGHGFAPVRHPRAFAYRKTNNAAPREAARPEGAARPAGGVRPRTWGGARAEGRGRASAVARPAVLPAAQAAAPTAPAMAPKPKETPAAEAARPAAKEVSLREVSRLGNEGRLEEAVELCGELIRREGARAEAYCLLGLLHNASGDDGLAEECFNKALYLEPNYYEALIHLALLLERRGETAKAAVLHERAQRVRRLSESGIGGS